MKKSFGLTLLLLSCSLVIAGSVSAYSFGDTSGLNKVATPSGYDTNATDPQQALPQRIGQIINIVISFMGVLFLGLTIYGGYRWMMAGGNESDVTLAKKIITRALIGLAIVFSAYIITMTMARSLAPEIPEENFLSNIYEIPYC